MTGRRTFRQCCHDVASGEAASPEVSADGLDAYVVRCARLQVLEGVFSQRCVDVEDKAVAWKEEVVKVLPVSNVVAGELMTSITLQVPPGYGDPCATNALCIGYAGSRRGSCMSEKKASG